VSGVVVRPAVVADATPILKLVNELAMQQVMLPRSPASVIENIRDFLVAEVDGEFAGCGALAVTWTDLGEVRSLAVSPTQQKKGVGLALVDALVADARRLGLARLFAFTYVPDFFQKFLACDEIAMTRVLDPKASPARWFGKPQRAIPLPQRSPAFVAPTLPTRKKSPRAEPGT